MKISEIAECRIGYQFRERAGLTFEGTHGVIQIRDIDENRRIQTAQLYRFTPSSDMERYTVMSGDLLFLARGHKNFAILMESIPENLIAANYFFILRLKTDKVLAGYLLWYLNDGPGQAYIQSSARHGSHIPFVQKGVFEEMDVAILPITVQQSIAEVNQLGNRERELMANLEKSRHRLINHICFKSVGRYA